MRRTGVRILSNADFSIFDVTWRPSAIPMAAIFFLPLLAGCVTSPPTQDVGMLQQQLTATEQDLSAAQASISQLEQQMAMVQKQSKQQAASLAALQASIAQIQSRLAASSSDTQMPADSRARLNMEKKLDQIEATLDKSEAGVGGAEKNAYTAAYLALKSGRYDEASSDFAHLIKQYPQGEYIDQALYWYGESLYAQHRLKQAATVLEKAVRKYPHSSKRDSALLRLGSIYKDLHRTDEAVAVFKRLIREYPHTVTADHARLALRQIAQEKKK